MQTTPQPVDRSTPTALSSSSSLMVTSDDHNHSTHLPKWVRSTLHRLHTTWQRRPPPPTDTSLASPSFATMDVSSQLKQVFHLIDSNGDGKISPAELGDVLLRLGHNRSAATREAKEMVKVADQDGDGLIDLDEFMEVVNRSGDSIQEEDDDIAAAFQMFDVNRDGFISARELQRVLVRLGQRCSLRRCAEMIRGVDRDGDGLVDLEEFRMMMMMAGRPEGTHSPTNRSQKEDHTPM